MNIGLKISIESNRIKSNPKCDDEIISVYNDTPNKDSFVYQLRQRLKFLEDEILIFRKRTNWFEKLVSNSKFDTIRFLKTEHNTRIVFYVTNEKPPNIILLYAFKEKSGNRGATIEYKNAAEIAEKRLNEVLKNGKVK